ncbi:hypothetical protein HHK36_005326 [Tetracentron sinense]|uniref:Protein kinase domain-containing protein n=1 Tax=Tetracentron sinense TaxID=13715 RepID=A0A834ZV93_TETSI|nr:hypothetical protein HHK36_005326 [Tetracentron sinense]
MGCNCFKASAIEDSKESPGERLSSKAQLNLRVPRVTSSRREEILRAKDRLDNADGRVMLIEKQSNGSTRLHGENVARKREKTEYVVPHHPGMGSISKVTEGEHVAAGWPSWLAAVAGEAIRGWIGQGTYSNVYRARDLDHGKIVALKKSTVKVYMQQLLRGLDHCHSRGVLHRDIKGSNLLIDNSGILKIADFGLASFFDPHQSQPLTSRVVTLWYRPPELLLGATHYAISVDLWSTGCILAELYAGKPIMPGRTEVEQLHKIFKLCGSPSEDYWRKSKLPHATIFKPQQPYRRCVAETFKDFPAAALELMETLLPLILQIVELQLLLSKVRDEEMAFGRGHSVRLCRERKPSNCLILNDMEHPKGLGKATETLSSYTKAQFFTTKPLACDPSSLPKYPPSKEFDAKARDEEARRQGAAGGKGQRVDPERRGPRESRAIPAPDANAELVLSMQKRQGQSNSKSRSEKFNSHQEEVASGFPIDPPRQSQAVEEASKDAQGHFHKRASHSGPLVHRAAWAKAGKNLDDASKVSTGADLSTLSGLVAARRTLLSEDRRENSGPSQPEATHLIGRFPGSFNDASESNRKQDGKHHIQGLASSHQKEDGRTSSKEPILHGYGSKGNKIHYSGPLLVPSGNVDQMLKDHDRQIQEVVRRARVDKAKLRKIQAEGNRISANPIFFPGRGAG